MADFYITQNDVDLLLREKKLHLRAYLLNENNAIMDDLQGYITNGDGTEDATSDIRRTCNFTIHSYDSTYNIGEYNRIWLNNRVRIDLGFEDFDGIHWYTKGVFLFDNCQYAYTGSTRDISFSCSDLITTLDGTHGGILDFDYYRIDGYILDDETGQCTGNDIKKCVEDLLNQWNIKEYNVETIGQVSCRQGYATNWKQNRIDTGTTQESVDLAEAIGIDDLENDTGGWHMIPIDLEFSEGVTKWEILTAIRDIYPGYEMYFDKDGVFNFKLIPVCHHEANVLSHEQLAKTVISENCDLDLTSVRNATRVYGESIEYDYPFNSSSISSTLVNDNNVALISIEFPMFALSNNVIIGMQFPKYDESYNGLPIYFSVPEIYPLEENTEENNTGEIKYSVLPVNKRKATYLTDENGNYVRDENGRLQNTIIYEPILYNNKNNKTNLYIDPLDIYCFKYVTITDNNKEKHPQWQYIGMYQIEGYHENHNSDSPFSIEKIGYRLQVLSGGDYDNITTSVLAQERAEYETWLKSRLVDTITLETVIIPFLETNKKIEYRKLSDGSIDSYIIKNISYSFTSGTMTLTMCKFYELDPFIICS